VTGRGLRGRRIARLMLMTGFAPVALLAFLLIAAPNNMGGGLGEPSIVMWLVPAIGVAGVVVGLAWMIRIYRADPEGSRSWWRFDRS
jgi:hypothetical protein